MEVRWSPCAAEDLEAIFLYIEKDSSFAARSVVTTIYEGCSDLQNFPLRGRSSEVVGCRELIFAPLPYIAVYIVKEFAIEILHIYPGARQRH